MQRDCQVAGLCRLKRARLYLIEHYIRKDMGSGWMDLKDKVKQNIYLNIWSRALIRCYRSALMILSTMLVTNRHPLYRNYYVCPRRCNIAYLNIGKTGCSSIRKALLDCDMPGVEVSDNQEIHRYTQSLIKYRLLGKDRNRFVFAFVRNPFDRVVSLYKNKFRSLKNFDVEGFLYSDYLNGVFHPQMSFLDFVEVLVKVPDRLADRHFKSQFCMIYEVPGVHVSYIGKFESLTQDFEEVRNYFPQLGVLPHFNQSSSKSDYRAYYDHRTAQLIAERYKKDIEHFGYGAEKEALMRYLDEKDLAAASG